MMERSRFFSSNLISVILSYSNISMGGTVAVHVAAKKAIPKLAGLVVVDVVEGTAMASLMHMQKILSSRMQHFPSVEKAVEWSVKGGSLRNVESARISVPSTLKYDDSKKWCVAVTLTSHG